MVYDFLDRHPIGVGLFVVLLLALTWLALVVFIAKVGREKYDIAFFFNTSMAFVIAGYLILIIGWYIWDLSTLRGPIGLAEKENLYMILAAASLVGGIIPAFINCKKAKAFGIVFTVAQISVAPLIVFAIGLILKRK